MPEIRVSKTPALLQDHRKFGQRCATSLALRCSLANATCSTASCRCMSRSTPRRKVGNNTLLTCNNAASRKTKATAGKCLLQLSDVPDCGNYCPPYRARYRVRAPRNQNRHRSAMYSDEIFLWSRSSLICLLRVRRWGLRRLSEVHPHSAVHRHWRSGAGCSCIADAAGDVRPRHIADRPE